MKFSGKPLSFCAVLSLAILFAAVFTGCEQPGGVSLPPSVNIGSAGDLAKIGTDAAYPLNGNYTLDGPLTLSVWKPIGTAAAPFTGSFDGGGHSITITGFDPAALDASPDAGLFGYVRNGTVRRVNLSGTTITVSRDAVLYAGGIVGRGDNAHISDCHTTVDISAVGKAHNSSAGGVGGYLLKSVVTDCSASGAISLEAAAAGGSATMIYAGGLVGYSGGGSRTERSYAAGTVYAKAPYPYAGGLVGYNYAAGTGDGEGSVVAACYAAGDVTAEAINNGLPYAGGLAGYTSRRARLQDSYATGDVKAQTESKTAWAGGIAGSCAADGVISRCYARGGVEAVTSSNSLASPQPGAVDGAFAGGIAGYVYNDNTADTTVENCAALNSGLAASEGGTPGVHRIAGGIGTSPQPKILNNAGSTAITYTAAPSADVGVNGLDGAGTTAQPLQALYESLGWDFTSVWKMNGGYPVLRWQ